MTKDATLLPITTRVRPLTFRGDHLLLLDQTLLPCRVEHVGCATVGQVAAAISTLKVRGAPAIGIAAAYGMALAALEAERSSDPDAVLGEAASTLLVTRPTAVNLAWAVRRVLAAARREGAAGLAERVAAEARRIEEEDQQMCLAIARAGLSLVPERAAILTHCNAGALATAGVGTALGVVRAAHAAGHLVRLYVDETRPVLQGARLTAWECLEDGIPVTLQCDGAAASLLWSRKVDLVVVGADRIAANGDVANKVGTLGLALIARAAGIPFLVAAPSSTVDLATADGSAIPIEDRRGEEVTVWAGSRLAPEGVSVRNPAFDVTPASLVTAIVTEAGVLRPPFGPALRALVEGRHGAYGGGGASPASPSGGGGGGGGGGASGLRCAV